MTRDERPSRRAAALVDGARDQLLAGAGLAGDEHGRVGLPDELDLADDLLDGSAATDDAAVARLAADLVEQVFVFAFSRSRSSSTSASALRRRSSVSRRCVMSRNTMTAPMSTPRSRNRCRGVLDVEGYAVLAPEHLAVDLVHDAVAEGGIDRAVFVGIAAAVGMRVVDRPVHLAADDLARLPPQHALGRRVEKVRDAVAVDAVDAVAGGAENEPVLPLDILEKAFGALPFGDAAAHEEVGLLVDEPALTLGYVVHGDQSHGPSARGRSVPEYSSVNSRPSAWRGCSVWVQ